MNAMRRLVALPFSKSLEIAYKSIRVRFFRSLITTLSLVLAVAFLCYTQTGNNYAESMLQSGNQQVIEQLQNSGYDVTVNSTSLNTSPKQRWLVFLSLLVCIVGIINAQLMSVTERFREIGTMKCLGALDRFIVRLFILEAGFQGIAGATAGAVLGSIVALLSGAFRFGFSSLAFIVWADLFVTIFLSILIGTGLSLLGVLYPALLAARMQPVEAMRVDQ